MAVKLWVVEACMIRLPGHVVAATVGVRRYRTRRQKAGFGSDLPTIFGSSSVGGGAQRLPDVRRVGRVSFLARRYGFDVLIVLAAVGGAFEVVVGDAAAASWFAALAVALVVLPLLARRQFPFAAPVAVWLLAAGL